MYSLSLYSNRFRAQSCSGVYFTASVPFARASSLYFFNSGSISGLKLYEYLVVFLLGRYIHLPSVHSCQIQSPRLISVSFVCLIRKPCIVIVQYLPNVFLSLLSNLIVLTIVSKQLIN